MASTKKWLVIVSLSIIGLILLTVVPYVYKFHHNGISPDPVYWAAFGDYFGGILNPIIAIGSLAVLGTLTILIDRKGAKENLNLYLLEQRMIAYKELIEPLMNLKKFNSTLRKATSHLEVASKLDEMKLGSSEVDAEFWYKSYQEIEKLSNMFQEFYFILDIFAIKNGHVFKYNFACSNFNELKNITKKYRDLHEELPKIYINGNIGKIDMSKYLPGSKFNELSVNVVNKMREEVLLPHLINIENME